MLRELEHDPQQLRDDAGALLDAPPFTEQAGGPLARALRWLGDQLAPLLSELLGSVGTGALGWVVLGVGLVAVVALVWRLTRGLTLDGATPRVPAATPPRTAARWLELAGAAEQAGARRESLRCRYGALVATLAELGLVPEEPGRTVGELEAEVAIAAPAAHGAVQAAGERFTAGWYGARPVTPADLAVVDEALEVVQGLTARRRGRR